MHLETQSEWPSCLHLCSFLLCPCVAVGGFAGGALQDLPRSVGLLSTDCSRADAALPARLGEQLSCAVGRRWVQIAGVVGIAEPV